MAIYRLEKQRCNPLVASFAGEVNASLAKPPLKFSGGLVDFVLNFLTVLSNLELRL